MGNSKSFETQFNGIPERNISELETQSFAKQFRAFLDATTTVKASHEDVNGKEVEYIKTSQLYDLYKETFGDAALSPSALNYRIQQLMKKNMFPEELVAIDTAGVYEARYYVNRLNKELLSEIYLPASHKSAEPKVIAKVNELNQAFYNPSPSEDPSFMHILEDESEV
ncbi:MAG: hypothetical protein MUD00_03425 [Candidatus Pacebacteria bacterium]|jgi:hypothetical protein|nr:hypothetical protein [Candidatus Paceibacterota bacterium]